MSLVGAAMRQRRKDYIHSLCHAEGSRGISHCENYLAAKDVSTALDMTKNRLAYASKRVPRLVVTCG